MFGHRCRRARHEQQARSIDEFEGFCQEQTRRAALAAEAGIVRYYERLRAHTAPYTEDEQWTVEVRS